MVNKRLKQNWEYEEKNLVLHLNYSFHNYLRLQWALRQFVGNALGNGNPLGKFKVPLTSVCLSSPSGWTSHLLNNPLAKLLHGSTSSWSSSQGQITDGWGSPWRVSTRHTLHGEPGHIRQGHVSFDRRLITLHCPFNCVRGWMEFNRCKMPTCNSTVKYSGHVIVLSKDIAVLPAWNCDSTKSGFPTHR